MMICRAVTFRLLQAKNFLRPSGRFLNSEQTRRTFPTFLRYPTVCLMRKSIRFLFALFVMKIRIVIHFSLRCLQKKSAIFAHPPDLGVFWYSNTDFTPLEHLRAMIKSHFFLRIIFSIFLSSYPLSASTTISLGLWSPIISTKSRLSIYSTRTSFEVR